MFVGLLQACCFQRQKYDCVILEGDRQHVMSQKRLRLSRDRHIFLKELDMATRALG